MSERRLYLSDNQTSDSRIGGAAPRLDYEPGYLDRYRYLCTIGHAHLPTVDDQDVSVFVRNGFLVTEDDSRYPNLGIDCVMHPPAAPRDDDLGRLTAIGAAGLSGEEDARDPDYSVIRIAATPQHIQHEPSYAAALVAYGYSFIFELDEEGYDSDFLHESFPFNYGALYVYGRRSAAGLVSEVVAGYIQFS